MIIFNKSRYEYCSCCVIHVSLLSIRNTFNYCWHVHFSPCCIMYVSPDSIMIILTNLDSILFLLRCPCFFGVDQEYLRQLLACTLFSVALSMLCHDFDFVMFAVDRVVSRAVSQFLTCDQLTCVLPRDVILLITILKVRALVLSIALDIHDARKLSRYTTAPGAYNSKSFTSFSTHTHTQTHTHTYTHTNSTHAHKQTHQAPHHTHK